jgi:hypothetical protein
MIMALFNHYVEVFTGTLQARKRTRTRYSKNICDYSGVGVEKVREI